MSKLDKFDLSILKLLQSQARMKSEAIAEEVGLSATAVQRRIKRLRATKVICSDVVVVDPEKVGGRTTTVVGVVVEKGTPDTRRNFRQCVDREEEVQQCYWVTGEFDYFLIVSVRNMSDYEALVLRLFIENPDVRRFDTFVSMETVKQSLQVPL